MNRNLFTIAFVLGTMAVIWVGIGFMGASSLALLMTAIIGAVYGLGALELWQFRQANTALATSLAAIPDKLAQLDDWLGSLPPSLQNSVRLRIEGERTGLPGPALTPFLVGLLVMLGMLGTFLGMVVTLNGAAFSLEGTTDLMAIRAALATPIKGLGLAFGTSVAGVASSAMLGLMLALSRRERMQTAQLLDTHIATTLRGFSLPHQRQETYKALQLQSQALPEVTDKLLALMTQMERTSQQLSDGLLRHQDRFHTEMKAVYRDLAASVGQSLNDSLKQSAQTAGDSLKPLIDAAMAGIAQETRLQHERVVVTTQLQLDGLSQRLGDSATAVTATWAAALATHERTNASLVSGLSQSLNTFTESFEQRSVALLALVNQANADALARQALGDQQRQAAWRQSLTSMATELQAEWRQTGAQTLAQQQQICATLAQTAQEISTQAQVSASRTLGDITRLMASSENLASARITSEADWLLQNSEHMEQLASLLRAELGALRAEEAQRGDAAVERLDHLQGALASHLSTLGIALEEPIKRLIETAAEAPRAAADVIGQLRQEMSNSLLRDNELLVERSRTMETLNSLLDTVRHAAVEQRAVIDSLVTGSAAVLNNAGHQFSEQVAAQTTQLSDVADHVASSAVEVSSLGEAFGFAVNAFSQANDKLIGNLQRIEAAMDKSMARSDDQLAYYIAQAREIIDLSTLSQREVFEELRQLPRNQALSAQKAT